MKMNRIDRVFLSLLGIVGIYLFAQSPMPLDNNEQAKGELIPVNTLFELVAKENNKAREQWTKKIVVAGKNAGLKFGEEWRKAGIDEGPLPALFLREVATQLEKSPVPLSLFLGSDFPISSANKFEGKQEEAFQNMRNTNGEAQFFFSQDVNRYTAMFADNVVVEGCASCHNEHPDSPKKDWVLNDLMGATTWAYPKEFVTRDELVKVLSELRGAFSKTYSSYLEKTKTYENSPEIGDKWPVDGYFLPSVEVFVNRFEKAASVDTLGIILNKPNTKKNVKTKSNEVISTLKTGSL
jgi:hypothetical protein